MAENNQTSMTREEIQQALQQRRNTVNDQEPKPSKSRFLKRPDGMGILRITPTDGGEVNLSINIGQALAEDPEGLEIAMKSIAGATRGHFQRHRTIN